MRPAPLRAAAARVARAALWQRLRARSRCHGAANGEKRGRTAVPRAAGDPVPGAGPPGKSCCFKLFEIQEVNEYGSAPSNANTVPSK